MKRWLVVALVAAAMALVPTTAAANAEHGNGQHGNGDGQHGNGDGEHFGPYSSSSPDSGTCGNDWATDTFNRKFFVQPTGATWRVKEAFLDGHFVTIAGQSPGACQASLPHGTTIADGKTGKFAGFLDGTVTGGTYNPNGCSVAAACSTTSGFIKAVFGPSAGYSCVTGVGACSFYFDYHAHDQGLKYRHWTNASTDLGGNRGDIATI